MLPDPSVRRPTFRASREINLSTMNTLRYQYPPRPLRPPQTQNPLPHKGPPLECRFERSQLQRKFDKSCTGPLAEALAARLATFYKSKEYEKILWSALVADDPKPFVELSQLDTCLTLLQGIVDDKGRTVAHVACRNGHMKVLAVILNAHRMSGLFCDWRTHNDQKLTLLEYAVMGGNLKVVETLKAHYGVAASWPKELTTSSALRLSVDYSWHNIEAWLRREMKEHEVSPSPVAAAPRHHHHHDEGTLFPHLGLTLLASGAPSRVHVVGVAGPAEAAGIRVGAVLSQINCVAISETNLHDVLTRISPQLPEVPVTFCSLEDGTFASIVMSHAMLNMWLRNRTLRQGWLRNKWLQHTQTRSR